MSGETLRQIHERCKARHQKVHPSTGREDGCTWCRSELWPCPDYSDAVAALALLNEAVETEARVTTPSGFKVYKPARIVSDWMPGSNEPPAHGWPDPVVLASRDPQDDEQGPKRD